MEKIYPKADDAGLRFMPADGNKAQSPNANPGLGDIVTAFASAHADLLRYLAQPHPLVKEKKDG